MTLQKKIASYEKLNYNRWFWWRRFKGRETLHKYQPLRDKIKNGDYPNNYLNDAIKGALTRNNVNKESNNWLVDAISTYHQENEPMDTIILLDQIISSITKNDVSLFANQTFDNKYIQASLMPKK